MSTRAIVPVRLSLTEGDFYTLWAPSWREHGSEWQAFLGSGENLWFFTSPAALLAHLESGVTHDLTEHPDWSAFADAPEDKVVPAEEDQYDIVGAPALLAEKPTRENVNRLSAILQITRSLADVSDAEDATVFLASHSILGNVKRGAEHYSGDHGLSEWSGVGRVILANWAKVVASLDGIVTLPEVPEEQERNAEERIAAATAAAAERERKRREEQAAAEEAQDPYDSTPWAAAGIDPVKIVIDGSTLYTLRTYVDEDPIFLGRYGEIFTFNNRKALVRWIISHDEHDLARVSTWPDLVNAANAGELAVTAHADNSYSFTGLAADIAKGPDAVDNAQMSRCYELMADAADWAGDDSMNSFFLANPRMQDYISYMLGSTTVSGYVPSPPYTDHSEGWKELEGILTKRFSRS